MKYIYKFLLKILPVLILIFFVFLLHYNFIIEPFFKGTKFKELIDNKKLDEEEKCINDGYTSCADKEAQQICKKEYYNEINEDDIQDGKKKYYKSCQHKLEEIECRKQGYGDCEYKRLYFSSKEEKRSREKLISDAKRINMTADII